jgi:hypothetical protein
MDMTQTILNYSPPLTGGHHTYPNTRQEFPPPPPVHCLKKWGGDHPIIAHKVKNILYMYFPEN